MSQTWRYVPEYDEDIGLWGFVEDYGEHGTTDRFVPALGESLDDLEVTLRLMLSDLEEYRETREEDVCLENIQEAAYEAGYDEGFRMAIGLAFYRDDK